LKPFSVVKQLEEILRENGPTMEVTALCSKFVQKFHVSVANIAQQRPADFLAKEKDTFALLPGNMVTLKEFEVRERAKVTRELRDSRSRSPQQRRAASPAQPKEWGQPKDWGTVRAADASRQSPGRSRPVALARQKHNDESMYQELHDKISSRSFNSRVAQALSTITDVVKDKTFLNVEDVVKGGSVAKGTALTGCNDAELVFFVKGLPKEGHQKWLPPLLKSVYATLERELPEGQVTKMECTADAVVMDVKNLIQVHLRFSPSFGSYSEAVQALGSLNPNMRKSFDASFVAERTLFISKQPGHVKVTTRLLKWWRDQQTWSCDLTRPSDYLLELVAIYVSQQSGKVEQSQAVANCMSVLSRFDQLRVVWSNFYEKSDIWSPLMMQKPLLMDPVNPFSNIADPQDFDARELMSHAATTRFFY
jgi:hypothetical protein